MSGGGAIGVIAFTRGSNNGVGREFLIGVIDALWPSAYPDFGDDRERHRLGDMLNHARARMTVSYAGVDPSVDGYYVAWSYARMLTLFGDPTLEVWLENPDPLPNHGHDFVAGPVLELVYPLGGATITVFEQTAGGLVPIGRAVAQEDGSVVIHPVVSPTNTGALRFFASAPGAVSTEVTVSAASAR